VARDARGLHEHELERIDPSKAQPSTITAGWRSPISTATSRFAIRTLLAIE
jgi:hypothetical protein